MKRLIGLSLTIALGLAALAAVPATANSDTGTDVEHGIACGVFEGGDSGVTEHVLNRWKGDEDNLMCRFKGLDMTNWDGVKYTEGFSCGIAANPDSPFQPPATTTDSSWCVNAQGNGTLRCSATAD